MGSMSLKEEMKRDGIYTPDDYRAIKRDMGWLTEKHGSRKPKKYARDKREERYQG
jgi:hypothetical protein